MSRRISVALTPTDTEWNGLLAPFTTTGANDPVIIEARQTLRGVAPDWVGDKRLRETQLSVERLEEIAAAARRRAQMLDGFPRGEARDTAHAQAEQTAELAQSMINELSHGGVSGDDTTPANHHEARENATVG